MTYRDRKVLDAAVGILEAALAAEEVKLHGLYLKLGQEVMQQRCKQQTANGG